MIKQAITFLKGYGIRYDGVWTYVAPALAGIHGEETRVYPSLYALLTDNCMELSIPANDIKWETIRYINDHPSVFTKAD